MNVTQETRLKKAHVSLMKHPETALYSGVMLMGSSRVVDDDITAYTNGVDKTYGRKFMESLTDEEIRALVLHENLHVALKHIQRFKTEFKENPMLVNASADFVVNDIIVNIQDRSLCKLPKGGLVDKKYHNWSVREVYNDLKDQQSKQSQDSNGNPSQHGTPNGSGGIPKNSFDEHEWEDVNKMNATEIDKLTKDIDKALREGSVLAGKVGAKIPRAIEDLLAPKINWRQILREFVSSAINGKDEYSWRRYSKRLMANDIYMPTTVNESVGELVIAMDTSGSIGTEELTEFVSELVSICDTVQPEKIRVLWWDTDVHEEETYTEFNGIERKLSPKGGGGTDASCVSEYIMANKIICDACIVFTDGYFHTPKWDSSINTMWLVTQNDSCSVPHGTIVKQEL